MIDWKKPVPDTHNGENSQWKPQRSLSKPVPGSGNVSCHETERASQPGGISFALKISCLIPLNAFIYPIQEPLVLKLAADVSCGLPRSFCTWSLYFFWVEPNLQVYRNLLQLTILQNHLVFILNVDFPPLTSAIRFHQQESAWYPTELHSVHQWIFPYEQYRPEDLGWDICFELLLGMFSGCKGDQLMEKSLSEYDFHSVDCSKSR